MVLIVEIGDDSHSRFDAGVYLTSSGSMNRQLTQQQRKRYSFSWSPEEVPTGDIFFEIHRNEITII